MYKQTILLTEITDLILWQTNDMFTFTFSYYYLVLMIFLFIIYNIFSEY